MDIFDLNIPYWTLSLVVLVTLVLRKILSIILHNKNDISRINHGLIAIYYSQLSQKVFYRDIYGAARSPRFLFYLVSYLPHMSWRSYRHGPGLSISSRGVLKECRGVVSRLEERWRYKLASGSTTQTGRWMTDRRELAVWDLSLIILSCFACLFVNCILLYSRDGERIWFSILKGLRVIESTAVMYVCMYVPHVPWSHIKFYYL